MPLTELLQWAGGNQKTGVLDLERNKIHRQIAFREGLIVGCASNDPTSLMGHFLISRGKITERTLQYALKLCSGTETRLTEVLIEMGVLSEQDVADAVSANASETIYGLFEWRNAVFRFRLDDTLDQTFDLNLSVESTLLTGAQRQDDLQRIGEVFENSGVVLARTDQAVPTQIENAALIFPLLNMIDSQRTIAELVILAHASEFQVLKVLFDLHSNGNVEVVGTKELPKKAARTLIDARVEEEPELPSLEELLAFHPHEDDAEAPQPAPEKVETAETKDEPKPASVDGLSEPADLDILIQFASEKLDRGDELGALQMLDTAYRFSPDDASLKKRIAKTEAAYLEKIRKYLLPPEHVPVRVVSTDDLESTRLEPVESSVLGMIDGETNIQSISWIAPLREVELMRTLQGLHDRGLIRIDKPREGEAVPSGSVPEAQSV